jgi:SAM-dependent methyltransferase
MNDADEASQMEPTTARLFDAMAEDYDVLEPWYAHLYAVLHPLVCAELAPPADGRRRRALDAGCGTGFQTALLERLGYASHGVDIAPRLLAAARRRLATSALALGTVEALPYRDESFDVVTCCGSTLSFVDAPATALRELGRVLHPGGRLLLECEHRWSLDLGWALLSALTRDSLGYGLSTAAAWRQLARRPREGCTVEYPGYGRLRLFTRAELSAMLAAAGLHPLRWWGIHSLTNVIPSTVLHRERLGPALTAIFGRLRAIDVQLSAWTPAQRLANSLVVLAKKR